MTADELDEVAGRALAPGPPDMLWGHALTPAAWGAVALPVLYRLPPIPQCLCFSV